MRLHVLGRAAATLVLLAASFAARAYSTDENAAGASDRRHVGVLLRMGFDFGGDKVQDVHWSDGSTTSINAGQLITFAAGVLYHPEAPWAVEGTIGYKFDKANGSNGTIEFTRIPLDLVASYVVGGHRFGVGPTLHFSPTYNCSATGVCSESVSFDTALGGIAQWAYGFKVGLNGGLDVGARFTAIRYSSSVGSLDGSSFGFFFGGWF